MNMIQEYALILAVLFCLSTLIIHIEILRRVSLYREKARRSHSAAAEQCRISEKNYSSAMNFRRTALKSYDEGMEFWRAGTEALAEAKRIAAAKEIDQAG